jgi:hypothetical protein
VTDCTDAGLSWAKSPAQLAVLVGELSRSDVVTALTKHTT